MNNDEVLEAETQNINTEDLEKIKSRIINNDREKELFGFYDKLRKKFSKKNLSGKTSVKDYLFILPDFFVFMVRLMFEKRVGKSTKTFIAGLVAYVILPIDLIPDFIPVIGFVDDLIIVAIGLNQIIKETDNSIIADNWSGNLDLFKTITNILSLVDKDSKLFKKIRIFIKGLRSK